MTTNSKKLPANYEDALAELELLITQLESSQMPLERMIEGYQRGSELLEFCRGKLQAVEDQVKLLGDGGLKAWSSAA
jgi:exodeoxyribonuclease VII small subunit